MKGRIKKQAGLFCFFVGMCCVMLFGKKQVVSADTWGNAADYYHSYGNRAMFRGTSATDGYIYYATRGVEASSGVKYQTIGWKISAVNSGGGVMQTLYVQLGGAYLSEVNSVQNNDNIYNLYAMRLGALRGRLNGTAANALNQGNCYFVFDACMVVTIDGVAQGSMNDSGITSGSVYESYDGIVNAAGWTSASREALYSYYNKSVDGLYCNVSVGAGAGIAAVSGGGKYCYGTYITVSAAPSIGYLFSHWGGSVSSSNAAVGFYVTGDMHLTAYGKPKIVTVAFYQNAADGDLVSRNRQYTYGVAGQHFENLGYRKEGYHQVGWSEDKNAVRAEYGIEEAVSHMWINNRYPAVTLYAVWEVNTYYIAFHGNGSPSGEVPVITADYEQVIRMPPNGFSKPAAICTYLGWGHNREAFDADYDVKQDVPVKLLAARGGVLHENMATILLYAIWDYAPEIHTGDLYYSLTDAQTGKLTEAELAKGAFVTDREDGNIPYGNHAGNRFLITDYDADVFLHLDADAGVVITYEAVDHVGNRVEEKISVYIVDTTVTGGRSVLGKIRFVDEAYLYSGGEWIPEESGGLKKDSRWRTDAEWQNLLWESVKTANLP